MIDCESAFVRPPFALMPVMLTLQYVWLTTGTHVIPPVNLLES